MNPDRSSELMQRALAQAHMAEAEGEVPVGAVIQAPDGTLYEDHNRTRSHSAR